MRHNYLERLPKLFAPRLRELSIMYNGPLFQFEDDDVTMFVDRWPSLTVNLKDLSHISLQYHACLPVNHVFLPLCRHPS